MTALSRDPERLLLPPIRAGIALVLLVPLVSAPWTLYPFPVGKAVYARVLIAAVFALWAILALVRPNWRPPRSALLALLGAWLGVAVLSAVFGVSPGAQLLVDLRPHAGDRERGALGRLCPGRGLGGAHRGGLDPAAQRQPGRRACGVAGRDRALRLAGGFAAGAGRGGRWPRIGASAGNPILLGAYLQAITLLAVGFLVRSWAVPPSRASAPDPARPGARADVPRARPGRRRLSPAATVGAGGCSGS